MPLPLNCNKATTRVDFTKCKNAAGRKYFTEKIFLKGVLKMRKSGINIVNKGRR